MLGLRKVFICISSIKRIQMFFCKPSEFEPECNNWMFCQTNQKSTDHLNQEKAFLHTIWSCALVLAFKYMEIWMSCKLCNMHSMHCWLTLKLYQCLMWPTPSHHEPGNRQQTNDNTKSLLYVHPFNHNVLHHSNQ